MCCVDHPLAIVAVVTLSLCCPGRADPPPADGKAAPEANKPARADLYDDPLPPGALARMGTVQLRHVSTDVATAFSPDGKVLATGDENSLRLWSMATGKVLLRTKENYELGPMLFSPDGKWLVTSGTQSICLLDAATGKLVRRIPAAPWGVRAFS